MVNGNVAAMRNRRARLLAMRNRRARLLRSLQRGRAWNAFRNGDVFAMKRAVDAHRFGFWNHGRDLCQFHTSLFRAAMCHRNIPAIEYILSATWFLRDVHLTNENDVALFREWYANDVNVESCIATLKTPPENR